MEAFFAKTNQATVSVTIRNFTTRKKQKPALKL